MIFEWTAINDTFEVDAEGSLCLPLVGTTAAAGQTLGILSQDICERLVQSTGLGRAPDVALDVVQFRRFYIVGDVASSGEYPYRPGLTVLQVLRAAGGLRTLAIEDARTDREIISSRSDLLQLALARFGLVAKKAKFDAELNHPEQIPFPPALTEPAGDDFATVLIEQERGIFEARRSGLSTAERKLAELSPLPERESASLEI